MTANEIETIWAPRLLSVLRIVAALLFLQHGSQKLFGLPFPAANGLPAVGTLGWIAGVIELVGGVMLLLGLFTRPVAFILSGQMAFAYFIAHAPRGLFPISTNGNGGELAIVYCFLFLFLVAAGAGAWSLDAALRRTRRLPAWV